MERTRTVSGGVEAARNSRLPREYALCAALREFADAIAHGLYGSFRSSRTCATGIAN
jgi:hypothetical protein